MANLNSNSVSNISSIHHCSTSIRCCALGSCIEGGNLIAKEGGSVLIMSPAPSGYHALGLVGGRGTAIYCALTCAQAAFSCGDWFIPSLRDMLCASDAHQYGFWCGCAGMHWIDLACSAPPSSTQCACIVCIGTPTSGVCQGRHFGYPRHNNYLLARAVRRVFY